jgi:hypothetical protein
MPLSTKLTSRNSSSTTHPPAMKKANSSNLSPTLNGVCSASRRSKWASTLSAALNFADLFPHQDEAVRKLLIEAQVFLTYQRQLNNLSVQENRLRRQRDKDTAALRELQEQRKQQTKARLDTAARQYIRSVKEPPDQPFDPAQFGFEFSIAEIQFHAKTLERRLAAA